MNESCGPSVEFSHWQTWQRNLPEEQQLFNHTLEAVAATLMEKKAIKSSEL